MAGYNIPDGYPTYKGTDDDGLPIVRPPASVDTAGIDADSPEALSIIMANQDIIQKFVQTQRRNYALSGNAIHNASLDVPDLQLSYQNQFGREKIRLIPRVTRTQSQPTTTTPERRESTPGVASSVPVPLIQPLCLLVFYKTNQWAVFDMASISPNGVAPPFDLVDGTPLQYLFEDPTSNFSWNNPPSMQFGGAIMTPIDFTRGASAPTNFQVYGTSLSDGQDSGVVIGDAWPIINVANDTVYTPIKKFQFQHGKLSSGTPTNAADMNPYFIDNEGTYYYAPQIAALSAQVTLDPMLYGGVYAMDAALASQVPVFNPDTAETLDVLHTTVVFEFLQNAAPGGLGVSDFWTIPAKPLTPAEVNTQAPVGTATWGVGKDGDPQINTPNRIITGIWYQDTAGTPERGTDGTLDISQPLPWPAYQIPDGGHGGTDSLTAAMIDMTCDWVPDTTAPAATTVPLEDPVQFLKLFATASDAWPEVMQIIGPIAPIHDNQGHAQLGPIVDELFFPWNGLGGELWQQGGGGRSPDLTPGSKLVEKIWPANDLPHENGYIWLGWASAGDPVLVEGYNQMLAWVTSLMPQVTTYPLGGTGKLTFKLEKFGLSSQGIVYLEPWPPSTSEGFYYSSPPQPTPTDQDPDVTPIHLFTPFGDHDGLQSWEPSMHISNGAHYIQGYTTTDMSGNSTPFLFLDGEDFFDVLTRTLNCQATDICAIFMDIPYSIAMSISGIQITPPSPPSS